MGLTFNSGKLTRMANRLTQSQKAYKRYLIQDMEKLAVQAQKLARALAPYETGTLQNSIFAQVLKDDFTALSIQLYVSENTVRSGLLNNGRPYLGSAVVGNYAQFMETQRYKLGKKSRAKQAASALSQRVGRRYMDRAVELIRKGMNESMVESAQRAGFVKRGR